MVSKRRLKRQQERAKRATSRLPGESLTMDGIQFRSGGIVNGLEMLTRDWNHQAEESKAGSVKSANLDPSIIEAGLSAIRANAEKIKTGKTLRDLPISKKDVFFLIGAGGTLGDINKNLTQVMHEKGTTITTNRGLKWFTGSEELLDFGFFVDSKLGPMSREPWFSEVDTKKINSICSLNTSPEFVEAFKDNYFFGYSFGQVPQWEQEIMRLRIDRANLDNLDSGLCSLSSQIHLVHKLNPKAKIVLLGHDFAYHKGRKYFDLPFKANQVEQERIFSHPDFAFDIMPDKNQNFVITQEYLKRQAQIISAQIDCLTESGAKVYNASPGGILYTPNIIQKELEELLNEL